MANGAPIIQSRAELPGPQRLPQLPTGQDLQQVEVSAAQSLDQAETNSARQIAAVTMESGKAEAAFMQTLSTNVNSIAQTLVQAQQQTDLTERKTKGYVGYNQALSDFEKDPDWKTAPQRVRERLDAIDGEILSGLPTGAAAGLRQDLIRTRLSVEKQIQSQTTSKTQDAALAARDEATPTMLARAARSGSPEERTGLYADFDKGEDELVSKGMQTAQQAVQRKQSFRTNVDQADVMRAIKERPEQAVSALDNPEMFPTLSPTQREAYRAQAQTALDERKKLQWDDKAKTDPTAAAATFSRRLPADQVDRVFDRAIIQQESGGDPRAVSNKGALGIAQVMPGTARMMARDVGRPDLVDMSDGQLKATLTADPALARSLGLAYFKNNLKLFDGHLAPAIAAYHAGSGGAVKTAYEAARAKYGDDFTAEQFRQLLPDSLSDGAKRTKDYVADIYGRLGADPGRGGVSINASYRISNSVDTVLAAERAETKRNLQALVSSTDDERDAVITSFKSGYATNPEAVQAAKMPLVAAAMAGDASAAQKLRQFQEMEQNAPLVKEAYGLPPEQLETVLASVNAKLATGGASAADLRRRDVLQAVSTEVAQARTSNPIGLIERSGRAPVTQVPVPQDAAEPAFGAALAAREMAAATAQRTYGGTLKMLKPQEEIAMKARFADAQPDDKAALLRTAATSIPSEAGYRSFVDQTVGSDSLARSAGLLGRRDPQLSVDILRGQALLDQPGVKPKVADVREALREKLPSDVYPGEVQGDLIEAGLAVYAAEKQKAGALFDRSDRSGIERAIARVAGDMVKVNGRATPVPYGTPARDLSDAWRGLDQTTLDAAGGGFGRDGQPLDPGFLARHAVLRPLAVGGGSYSVYVPQGGQDRPVMTREGAPLRVDLPALLSGANRKGAATAATRNERVRAASPTGRPYIPLVAPETGE